MLPHSHDSSGSSGYAPATRTLSLCHEEADRRQEKPDSMARNSGRDRSQCLRLKAKPGRNYQTIILAEAKIRYLSLCILASYSCAARFSHELSQRTSTQSAQILPLCYPKKRESAAEPLSVLSIPPYILIAKAMGLTPLKVNAREGVNGRRGADAHIAQYTVYLPAIIGPHRPLLHLSVQTAVRFLGFRYILLP